MSKQRETKHKSTTFINLSKNWRTDSLAQSWRTDSLAQSSSCADPERFVRGGPTTLF